MTARMGKVPGREFEIGVLDDVLVFRLRTIRNALAERFRAGDWRDGMRAGDFTTLALIVANPGISQIDLARAAGFDQATLVRIIDDLERRGWACRTKDPADRRRHRLEPTADSAGALAMLHERARENERVAREALSAAELATLLGSLDRIAAALATGEKDADQEPAT